MGASGAEDQAIPRPAVPTGLFKGRVVAGATQRPHRPVPGRPEGGNAIRHADSGGCQEGARSRLSFTFRESPTGACGRRSSRALRRNPAAVSSHSPILVVSLVSTWPGRTPTSMCSRRRLARCCGTRTFGRDSSTLPSNGSASQAQLTRVTPHRGQSGDRGWEPCQGSSADPWARLHGDDARYLRGPVRGPPR